MNPSEMTAFWSVIVNLGVAVGVIVALVKGVQYLFELTPTADLKKRVSKIEEHDAKDLERFTSIERRIEDMERKLGDTDRNISHIDEGIQRLVQSQISLLHHLATGNGQKELLEEAENLSEYFINRR